MCLLLLSGFDPFSLGCDASAICTSCRYAPQSSLGYPIQVPLVVWQVRSFALLVVHGGFSFLLVLQSFLEPSCYSGK
jgi:hypothetical protein